jgi:hypothetical protein
MGQRVRSRSNSALPADAESRTQAGLGILRKQHSNIQIWCRRGRPVGAMSVLVEGRRADDPQTRPKAKVVPIDRHPGARPESWPGSTNQGLTLAASWRPGRPPKMQLGFQAISVSPAAYGFGDLAC